MRRKRKLGFITEEIYHRVLHQGLFTSPFGKYTEKIRERMESENPHIESMLRVMANRAKNVLRVSDLFFVEYEMLKRAKPLPLYTEDEFKIIGPVLNEELSKASTYFEHIRRIAKENPNFTRLLESFVKGTQKLTGVDKLEQLDLLTNSELIGNIQDGSLMLMGSVRHYLVLERA